MVLVLHIHLGFFDCVQNNAMEIFLASNKTVLLAFESTSVSIFVHWNRSLLDVNSTCISVVAFDTISFRLRLRLTIWFTNRGSIL